MGERSSTAQVTAIFAESSVHFEIAADTPIEQLCALLNTAGKGHGDLLLIEVSLPPPQSPKGNGRDGW